MNKKIFFIILSVILILTSLALADILYGDINNDGKVTNVDLILLSRYIAGIEVDSFDEAAADVNKDEKITNVDLILFKRYIAGVIDKLGPTSEVLKVHFIDVGQGDAILIQTPTQNILIDAGNRGDTVVDYLNGVGVKKLDLVIGTHPHADHIGGLINVIQSIPVAEVIDPGIVHTTKTFEDYLTLIDQKNIKFTEGRSGMNRDLGGGANFKIVHPSNPSSSNLNNASIVARVTFGDVSFMFAGDAEEAAENQIINRGYNLESTVLKVGHHGSRTSTTQAFLNSVNPEVAVIMCGSGNSYGHPHSETLQKLASAGVNIYRTDLHGNIVITTDGKTYDINIKQPQDWMPY